MNEQAHHRIAHIAAGSFETRHERRHAIALARSCEFEKAVPFSFSFEQDGIGVEVDSINVQQSGAIDIFARAWKGKDQIGFSADGSVDLERFWISNPALLVPDLSGDITIGKRLFRSDPAAAVRNILIDTIKDVGKIGAPITKDKRGRTTYTLFSGNDGYIESNDSTYATARAGSGLALQTSAISAGQDVGYFIEQGFVSFDTSSVVGTVSSATLSLFVLTDNSTTDFTINARRLDYATLTTADFVAGASLGALPLLATLATAGLGTPVYNAFTSDGNFLTNINQSGTTGIVLSSAKTDANTAPTNTEIVQFSSSTASGTTQDPKLVIDAAASAANGSFFLFM